MSNTDPQKMGWTQLLAKDRPSSFEQDNLANIGWLPISVVVTCIPIYSDISRPNVYFNVGNVYSFGILILLEWMSTFAVAMYIPKYLDAFGLAEC